MWHVQNNARYLQNMYLRLEMKMLLDTIVLFICVMAVLRNNKNVVFFNLITFIIQHLQAEALNLFSLWVIQRDFNRTVPVFSLCIVKA